MARYVSFLLSHMPGTLSVVVAQNEIEGYVRVSQLHPYWTIVDDSLCIMGPGEFRELLAQEPDTKSSKILLLTGEDPGKAAVNSHLRRSDRVLAKPFGAEALAEALAPHPRVRRVVRSALSWIRNEIRLRFDFECYTLAQIVLAGWLLAGLTGNVLLRGAAHISSPTLLLWASLLLTVSLAAHLRDRHMRWETLLFAKFSFLVSLIPLGTIQTAQKALNQAI